MANDQTTEWQPIETAPDDFERPGGQRVLQLKDTRTGEEFLGVRTLLKGSGWVEYGVGREICPTAWRGTVEPGAPND